MTAPGKRMFLVWKEGGKRWEKKTKTGKNEGEGKRNSCGQTSSWLNPRAFRPFRVPFSSWTFDSKN